MGEKTEQPIKPYGWEVDVEFHPASGKPKKTLHYVGTQSNARNNALMKSNAVSVSNFVPVTREQWVRAYGIGRK